MFGCAGIGITGIRLIWGANQTFGMKPFCTAIAGISGIAGIAVTDFLLTFHTAFAVDTGVGITGLVGHTITVI